MPSKEVFIDPDLIIFFTESICSDAIKDKTGKSSGNFVPLSCFEFIIHHKTKKYIANLITFSCIMLGIVLIFFPLLSIKFYILYSLSGLSDMADGIVERKMQTSSKFGSTLDPIADFMFFISCSVKILHILDYQLGYGYESFRYLY